MINEEQYLELGLKKDDINSIERVVVGDKVKLVVTMKDNSTIEVDLGNVSADQQYVNTNFVKKADNGTVGQFAVSDGNGGITWQTIANGNEVSY